MFQKIKNGEFVKLHLPKPVRNALISASILLLIFVGGGIAYTYFMGLPGAQDTIALAAPVTPTPAPVINPTMPAENARESASVQAISTPVSVGTNASMTVRTNAKSTCTISVLYKDVPGTDSGLVNKTADEYGMVTWTWSVNKSVPIGEWPVKVTCTYNGRAAVVQGTLQVTK